MSLNKNLVKIHNLSQYLPRMNDDVLVIVVSYLGQHPVARLIANMRALTMHVCKEDHPDRPLGQELELMDDSVFDEIKKFDSFEEHGGWVGFNPTFITHLVGCRTLKGTIWGKTHELPAVLKIIQVDVHSDRMKKKEWLIMHPDIQSCSEV